VAAIGVLRFRFFLRNRAAAGLVRRVAVAEILERLFTLAARGILLARRRIGSA
jgi:hypothetical protein